MARNVFLKFFAILLAAALLLTSLASGAAIIGLAASDLYSKTPDDMYRQMMEGRLESLAHSLVQRYLGEELGNCPEAFLDNRFNQYYAHPFNDFEPGKWFYVIMDMDGRRLDYHLDGFDGSQVTAYETVVFTDYPMVFESKYYDGEKHEVVQETDIGATVPMDYWDDGWFHYTDENAVERGVRIGWVRAEENYRVALYLMDGAYDFAPAGLWELLEQLWVYRFELIGLFAGSLLLFVLLLIYLCCVAAKKPKSEEIRPAGFNRLPLDLYAGTVGSAVVFAVWAGYELIVWNLDYFDPWWLLWALVGAMAYAGCLLIVCFLFGCAAQFKTPDGFWYKHSFVAWCFRLVWLIVCKLFAWTLLLCKKLLPAGKRLWEFGKALCRKLFSWAIRVLKKGCAVIKKIVIFLWRSLVRFASLLPLTWQWLLTAFVLVLIMMIVARTYSAVAVMLGLLVIIAIVLYGTYCFGTLLETTKRMSKGNLESKVEDKLLLGSFREFAGHLNDLADVAVEAARKQMKSERMKAELVTNVSHDIKTPLTSIINYVDLLQKAETPEQTEQYLEVLERQSLQLKKLIDDLMEMSKASTGNMAVELAAVDPVEAVNQALGEFSDKLEAAQLTPVFQAPECSLRMMADGRLTWRVLSNLLSNAVKYALPGTRLYIDIGGADGKVMISLKNISREQLNVSSEELLERFVRGDASRNTEGSGLGLNIALNLMELQKGKLQLLVDGDLFKATMIFPEA
ncbi:MAG: HAMP domain-containing histidine kinase [Oscillospiraceae bacterium]|nr:HAMP domain-containing histidine kinase [Oscillospiraceae bacterium]